MRKRKRTTTGMATINASGLIMQTRHVQPCGCGALESGPDAKKRSATITASAGNSGRM